MNKFWLGRDPLLPCWSLGIPQPPVGCSIHQGRLMGMHPMGMHCAPRPTKTPTGAPHGAGQASARQLLQRPPGAEGGEGGTSPMHLHYTAPAVWDPHSPPAATSAPAGLHLTPCCCSPPVCNPEPHKPITLSAFLPSCTPLQPPMPHPAPLSAAPQIHHCSTSAPRAHPISCACSTSQTP